MKVRIKDLKPNPFRDMKNYPIDNGKVQNLTNSIEQTGFWDNILGRLGEKGYFNVTGEEGQYVGKYNRDREPIEIVEGGHEVGWEWVGDIQIAYGHHRLVVLQKLFKPDDYVDIPVKELDDPTMIRIMANENDESWGTSPKIIDETVRVTRKFLEENLEFTSKLSSMSLERLKSVGVNARVIAKFLGGNWIESRVTFSLDRIRGEEIEETHEHHIDKEAVEMYPTERSARNFVKAVKEIKNITPEQQRNVAKRMVEKESFGEAFVKSELLDEKYKNKKTEKDQQEKNEIHFKNYMIDTTKIIKSLNDRFLALNELQSKYNFTFEIYSNSDEADNFKSEMRILIDYLNKFSKRGGENKNGENELLQISD